MTAVPRMTEAGIEFSSDGTIFLRGFVKFDTVGKLYRQMHSFKSLDSKVQIDWSDVEAVDSSAVALCLVWIETARKENRKIIFASVPDQMMRLIRVNQVQDLFNLD